MPSLFVIRGNDQGMRYDLEERVTRIGRDSANPIQLHDSEASRQHAEVRRGDDGFVVCDLKSSNGTFVNGQRVQEHTLATGDQVQIGGTLMLYTGPTGDRAEDLARIIDITSGSAADQSRIVRSLTHEEGSRLFDFEAAAAQNPWLARARSNLQVMYRTALAVSHTLDIDQLLQRIIELIFEWVEADRGCIMLMDPQTRKLQPKARRTRGGVYAEERIAISQTILDYVLDRNEGVLTSDAQQDQRWNPAASIVQAGVREAICVPMQGRYDAVGVIYIDTSTPPEQVLIKGPKAKFTEDHLKLMVAIGHQAALAIEDTRYYSAMVQAERLAAIGQTVTVISHHVKNILQGIRGGSYLIDLGLREHDESVTRKGWDIVEKNQNKISTLVMDMLTFSKEREPELLEANVNPVVGEVIELMQSRADEMQVKLTWQPAAEMPELVFDPEALHRAILNIVTNAIDAAADGESPGCVQVGVEYAAAEQLVRITVSDNGPGIPADLMDQLFSPFISTKKGHGTGLGLAVSQKILKEHGGQIRVESDPAQGTRFTLELPAILPGTSGQTLVDLPR